MAKGNSNSIALSIPIFTGEKYDIWSTKMKTYFLSQNLWNIVNGENPKNIPPLFEYDHEQQNDAAALFILQQAVDDNIFPKISSKKMAKEVWDTFKKEYQRNPQRNCKKYLPLYQAILKGNLEYVKERCDEDKDALESRITVKLDTTLHVAVGLGTCKANHIVKYLLDKMSMHQLTSLKNKEGNTVLSIAAIVNNLEATDMIMKRDKYLCLIQDPNNLKRIPLIEAARHGQKKMINYLLQFSDNYLNYVFGATHSKDKSGLSFINKLIIAGFYELALNLLQKHERSLDKNKDSCGEFLNTIAGKPSAFPSGRQRKLKFRHHFIIPKREFTFLT
ncbi:uncharacterized protein LOC116127112 [Pistacia vera]|uniref:uncharacterized protein LOC116127112 n=1 Tax=Pistacia vera TaxID=55513 RepID=UPI0012638F01|nr:uncharacterized protein LOC116127112 [Pistacia vera]